jgi:uncharacterized protein YbaR (Trm112 family)
MAELDPVLLEVLACPSADHAPVAVVGDPRDPSALRCTFCGTVFPITDGIPVMLLAEAEPGPRGIGVAMTPDGG